MYPDMFESSDGEVVPKPQSKEDKGEPHMYYMVLMDNRDDEHIVGVSTLLWQVLHFLQIVMPRLEPLSLNKYWCELKWITFYSGKERP